MSEISAVKSWAAPDDAVKKLQFAHTETVKRQNGLELVVSGKLDRNEIGYLDSLASNFSSFAEYQKETSATLERLREIQKINSENISHNKVHLSHLKSAVDCNSTKITTLTPKAETRALAKEISKHEELMKSFCQSGTVSSVSETNDIDCMNNND